MKKNKKKKSVAKTEFDLKLLKHWKNMGTKAKLDWLESAIRFGKLRKF